MNNLATPISSSSHSRGFTVKRVVIKGIAGNVATCDDGTGNLVIVPMNVLRSKANLPNVGEIWYLSRELGIWTFAAINGYTPTEGVATIANAMTSVSVTFGTPEPDANFGVLLTPGFDAGTIRYSNPSLTGFAIHVQDAPSGPGSVAWKLVRNSN